MLRWPVYKKGSVFSLLIQVLQQENINQTEADVTHQHLTLVTSVISYFSYWHSNTVIHGTHRNRVLELCDNSLSLLE